ncbi:MAG: NAD-dependent deacylase [Leptospiraceae bacterium]|nr:NAD-dependent deacylase [Leptospiraceae bacterium]MCP5495398.1 NAD-dependent deacylase [Leptospiraceae bacterium]
MEELKKLLTQNKKVAVLTGAGISHESGIPTFRGAGGYWKQYKAEELATPEAFQRDPKLVWEWYDYRRGVCAKAKPNPAHEVVFKMESYFPEFLVITQNVDGLHRRAGNKKIFEIHGNIFTARCTSCSNRISLGDEPLKEIPLKCNVCGSLARPHIVWFGESYDGDILDQCYSFLATTELIFVIGTSGQVSVPVNMAKYAATKGAYCIEVNPEETSVTDFTDTFLQGKAGEVLPQLWEGISN